jgi:cytochrome c553
MRNCADIFAILLATLVMLSAAPVFGQSTPANSNDSATCAGCHGQHGEGHAQNNFPRIAGQPQAYLEKQLSSYANGSRPNQIMTPIAKQLSPQQMTALSSYYAALAAPTGKPPSPAAGQARMRGETLAKVGDEKLGVQACANCHGPDGIGEPPTYPYLAGQHNQYLRTALGEWKSNTRNTDPSQQMNTIARRLDDSDIDALSSYFASLRAPPSEPHRNNTPMGSSMRPINPRAAPSSNSTPAQGIGTEQGAPTTGGSQGPGGGGGASGSGPSGTRQDNQSR